MSKNRKMMDSLEAEENLLIDFQLLLHRELESRGLSRVNLAEASGISEARLSQLFSSDANPTLKTCARLFHAIGEAMDLRIKGAPSLLASDFGHWNFDFEPARDAKSRRPAGERAVLVAAVKESIACNDNNGGQVEHWGEALTDCEAA